MNIASCIEYTNLNPRLTSKEIKHVVDLAASRKYRSVVLTYNNISVAKNLISKNKYDLKVVTVYGFPFDQYSPSILTDYKDFYDELDVVLPIQEYYFNYPPYLDIIANFLKVVKEKLSTGIVSINNKQISKTIKLIIETPLMRAKDTQIKELCKLAKDVGIDVIKTCTGLRRYKSINSLVNDVHIIRKYWKGSIKASGGIRTIQDCQKLIKVGATLIGTSSDILASTKEDIK